MLKRNNRKQDKATTGEMHSTTSYDHLVKLLVIGDSGELSSSGGRYVRPISSPSLLLQYVSKDEVTIYMLVQRVVVDIYVILLVLSLIHI